MNVSAVRLDSDPTRQTLHRYEFGPDLRTALCSARSNAPREVFIVREGDVALFIALHGLVVHRRKRPNKALSDLCLRQTLIPLVTGEYSSAGQFLRSVRTLLHNAIEKDVHNVFLIAAREQFFAQHRRHALEDRPLAESRGSRDDMHRRDLSAEAWHKAEEYAEEMMELLPHLPIPASLRAAYMGNSVHAQLVRLRILLAAPHDARVLILGEHGTGKEVVAAQIHAHSRRFAGKFVTVNCAAIPGELFESELFGVHQGAYTGAVARVGLWEQAHGGTLFLDEIGDLSPSHQAKILRALETNEVRRVGGGNAHHPNTRIIAATNRKLHAMVEAGQFREDLYQRLRVHTIMTTPLRSHPDDIRLLAQATWKAVTQNAACELSDDVIVELQSQPWPGNVRELESRLTVLHQLFGASNIRVEHLRMLLRGEQE